MNINFEFSKGVLFIRLEGYFTKDTIKNFKQEVLPILKYNEFRYIVLNFHDVKDFDYSAVRNIKKLNKLLLKWDGNLAICNVKKYLKCKASKYNFDKKYKLLSDELTALRSFDI